MLQDLMSSSDEQKMMKYWINKYMAIAVRDVNVYPEPDEVESVCPFHGFLRRWISRLILKGDLSCLYSLQKGSKQSWPAREKKYLVSALEKHEKFICTPRSPINPSVIRSIERSSVRIFRGISDARMTKFLPTGHACTNAKRSNGGTRSLCNPLDVVRPSEERSLSSYFSDTLKSVDLGRIPLALSLMNAHRRREVRLQELKCRQLLLRGSYELLRVEIMALPEPSKFRILSKMNGNLANILQPLQGSLLDEWKNTPYSTMRSEDLTSRIQEIIDAHVRLKSGFTLAVSGDYSSATDTLHRASSFAALKGAQKSKWYGWAKFSLQPGRVKYPLVFDELPDGSRKVLRPSKECDAYEGQLMGHPLSFPLLCVINLSTYHSALEAWTERAWAKADEYERRKGLVPELMDLVIVNGDDILFFCDQELYECWTESVKAHSFELSAGKNYLSTSACQINSQLFQLRNNKVSRVGYLQQKTIYGVDVKGGGDSQAGPVECARDLNRMVTLNPKYACCIPMVMARVLKNERFGALRPNWFFPECLGGLGLLPEFGYKKSTRLQRLFAAQLSNQPRPLFSARGLGDSSYIKIHQQSRIVVGDYVPESNESFSEDAGLAGRIMLVNQWIRLHDSEKPERKKNYFTLNRSLDPMSWRRINAYRDGRILYSLGVKCPPIQSLPSPNVLVDETGLRPV